ncbi:hypothetical protein [Sphingomonas sp. LHG3406-1]|uniref:CBU_0592 family membrane protein n=1 Tax=Sphingomonas sp. LHG3406-1 TaxID=2804617 RepID=UPI0026220710|nr:hypothetical protein [Sphingomonas sp. LHG3406-1]
MTERLMVDVAGWLAALLILGGYALLTAGKVNARSPAYQWMNVLGAIGFVINSGYFKAWPSAVLNVIWAGIGIVALIRIAASRKRNEAAF